MIRALLLASLLLSPLVASAETQARVEPGERRAITAHGVCRQVTNGNGTPVMIPLSTPQEWSQGGSAFLAAPRPGMTVESCTRDIWAWEYMTGTAVFWQGPSMTDYGAGGLEVQTRFTQYTGNPSSYLNLIPPCGPGKGGERVTIIQGTPGQMAVYMQHVCNNATPVVPFGFPNGTVAASGYWTSPQITLSGIPHTRTEALVVGVVGPGWSDPNGGCCSFNYDSRVLINGSASFGGNSVPIGRIDPASPYFADFVDAYGPAVNGSGVQTGPSFAVAVRNGDRIQLRLRATRDPGVTLTYFVKIGQHITYFTLTTT